jgi:hypothetical protein
MHRELKIECAHAPLQRVVAQCKTSSQVRPYYAALIIQLFPTLWPIKCQKYNIQVQLEASEVSPPACCIIWRVIFRDATFRRKSLRIISWYCANYDDTLSISLSDFL